MEAPWSLGQITSEVSGTGDIQLVAEENGVICAYIFLLQAGDEAELLRIGVAADARQQGVGAALLQAALRAAVENGAATCYLEVRDSNSAARSLYSREGFRIVGSRPRYYKNPIEDAVIMQKELFTFHGGHREKA